MNCAVAEPRLHDAISAWIRGELPEDSFDTEIADALAPGFRIVEPDGAMLERETVVAGLRRGHGRNPEFRISIENAAIIAESAEFLIVTYLERQQGARLTASPDNTRRSTLVLLTGERLRHLFLQETRLPD